MDIFNSNTVVVIYITSQSQDYVYNYGDCEEATQLRFPIKITIKKFNF